MRSDSNRKMLKARAHALHPEIHVGERGLTDAVLAEIDRALAAYVEDFVALHAARSVIVGERAM